MKVCLVKLPSPFLVDEKVMPPLGLLAVGTGLKNKGHKVYIYDGTIEDIPKGYDIYGVGATTPEFGYALQVKEYIKAPVIIGGAHATLNPKACFKFDTVVIGDGEDFDITASGIVYTQEKPLDDYPIIDRGLIDIKSYKYCIDGELATTMVTVRGCPYKCAFCAKNYRTTRLRSVDSVIQEIDYIYELGYRAIMFFDDIFILDKIRTLEIAEHLNKLGMVWRCFVRADLIVKYGQEFTDILHHLGCSEVGMGIESGSDVILANINKGENSAQIKEAIRILHNSGIRVKGFFIIGLPGENHITIEETKKFIKDTKLDFADFTIYQPYAGSPITMNKNVYDIDWDCEPSHFKGRIGEYKSSVFTFSLTKTEIVEAREMLACLN